MSPHRPSLSGWQRTITLSLFLGWCFYYLCRKSFSASIPSLIRDGYPQEGLGLVASCFAFSYGFSKFVGSVLADHFSPKSLFSAGLLLSGLCCTTFSASAWYFPQRHLPLCVVWIVQGIVQGVGWPTVAKLLQQWYSLGQLGTWWSVISGGGNIASSLSPIIFLYLSSMFGWQVVFLLVGLIAVAMSLALTQTLHNSPSDLGIQIEHKSNANSPKSSKAPEAEKSSSVSWYDVFFIRDVWIASLIYAVLYFVKACCTDWSQLYFVQVAHKSEKTAALCVSLMNFGGLFGNFFSGYISDSFITQRTEKTKCPRAPTFIFLSALLSVVFHFLLHCASMGYPEIWLEALSFMLGVLTDGGIALIGLIAMEIVPKQLSVSSHGLACAIAQVGSFFAGWPFSHLVNSYGWDASFHMLEGMCVLLTVLSVYFLWLLITGLPSPKLKIKKTE